MKDATLRGQGSRPTTPRSPLPTLLSASSSPSANREGPQRVSVIYKSLEVTHPAGSSPKGLPGDRVQFFFDSQRFRIQKVFFQKKEKKKQANKQTNKNVPALKSSKTEDPFD